MRKNNKQTSLFSSLAQSASLPQIRLAASAPAERDDKLRWEKELLGLYITEHPFTPLKSSLSGLILPLVELNNEYIGKDICVGGVISTIKKILTRRNETMLFVKIEDGVGNLEVIVFPKLLLETGALWQEGKVILIQGGVSDKDSELKLLANRAAEVTPQNANIIARDFKATPPRPARRNYPPAPPKAVPAPPEVLKLVIRELTKLPETLETLRILLAEHPGKNRVYLKVGEKIVATEFLVHKDDNLISRLREQLAGTVQVV